MNAGIYMYFLFVDRYHQLIANYGKGKKVEQISNPEDTTLGTTFDTKQLKEGKKKIQTEQAVFLNGFYLFAF